MAIQVKMTQLGTQIGRLATDKVGFYGTAPIVQPTSQSQTSLMDSTGGSTANYTLAAVGATNGSDVSSAINANFAKTAKLLNELRWALVSLGIIKGT